MPLPGIDLTVQDNGLGQSLPGNGNTIYAIGGAAQGPYFQLLQTTDPNAFPKQNGYGPGVEFSGFVTNSTGNEVAFVAVPLTGGANTAVAPNTPGGSTAAVTVSGTPSDTYYAKVTAIVGGTEGVAGIQLGISLDAGRTTAFTVNLPTSGLITTGTTFTTQTGLTITVGAGTIVPGDSWSWVSTEGVWTDAAINSAINAMLPIPSLTPVDIFVIGGSAARTTGNGYTTPGAGYPGTVGVQPGDATAFDGYMATLFNKRRYLGLVCAAGDAQWGGASTESEAVWMTSLETNFAPFVSGSVGRPAQVGITAGHYNVISPYSQSQFRRPNLWLAAARDSANAIQVKWGRGSDGALANVPNSPPPVADGFIYHDESVSPGLDAARFITLMTRTPKPGWYFANDNLFCTPGSDFEWFVHLHVIMAMCLVGIDFFIDELEDAVRVNAQGTILPIDANDIQTRADQALANALVNSGAMSSAECIVSLTDNILQTATLSVTFSGQPLGYIDTVDLTITFTNVAAVVVQSS